MLYLNIRIRCWWHTLVTLTRELHRVVSEDDKMLVWLSFWGCWEKCHESDDGRQPGSHLWSKPDVVKKPSISCVARLCQRLFAAIDHPLRRSLCQIAVFCRVNTQTSCLLVYCLLQLCICISQMCCLLAYCLLQSHYPYLCVKMFIVCYLYATLECFVIECAKVHNNSYCIKFLIKTNICIFTYLFMFMYYT